MNSGIRDAHNLGWKLAEVVAGRLGPGLLATYQQERAPHAWALIELAINMGRVMMRDLVSAGVRGPHGFPRGRADPGAAGLFFADERQAEAVLPRRLFELRTMAGFASPAGCCDSRWSSGGPHANPARRNLGPRFSLLAYGADAQTIAAAARQLDFGLGDVRAVAILPAIYNADPASHDAGVTVGRDLTGEFARRCRMTPSALMVVRPDRYVAAARRSIRRAWATWPRRRRRWSPKPMPAPRRDSISRA